MVSNDLALPWMLRWRGRVARANLGGRLLLVRRLSIVLILLVSYFYVRSSGEGRSLVAMGLISFVAVAHFAPGVILGMVWRQTRLPAVAAGLAVGFLLWLHTLFLPTVWPDYASHWRPWLQPNALFGYSGFDALTHGAFFSLAANLVVTVSLSLFGRPVPSETAQAEVFVSAMLGGGAQQGPSLWRGGAAIKDLHNMLVQVVGEPRAERILAGFASSPVADAPLLQKVEAELAGAVGSASARILVGSVAGDHAMSQDEVLDLLAETSEAIRMARALKHKSDELERATDNLRAANARLRELDRLKDDFVSTMTHELRTPLTSIKAFSEIMRDSPDLPVAERERFCGIVVSETERLSRLINQVLDLSKLESGVGTWRHEPVALHRIIQQSLDSLKAVFEGRGIGIELQLDAARDAVLGDADRIQQVLVNLLSNAVNYCPDAGGRIRVASVNEGEQIVVSVADNGPGIRAEEQAMIFERFRQSRSRQGRLSGTGLGLSIARQIVEHMKGRIWVRSTPPHGAEFLFSLPLNEETA